MPKSGPRATPGRLAGKTAIVTGAASGIGRAVAEAYVAEGADVILGDANLDGAAHAVQDVAARGGFAIASRLDVRDQASVDAVVALAVAQFGGVDILFNSAGVIRSQPDLEATRESFQFVFDVNVFGLFFMSQAVARRLVEQGRGGKIINVASISGRRGYAGATQYSASKAAVISMTQSMALSLAPLGVQVNAIAPGYVRTGMWDEIQQSQRTRTPDADPDDLDRDVATRIAAGRLANPADMVGAAIFLASGDSDYIVGQTLNVDGGNVLN